MSWIMFNNRLAQEGGVGHKSREGNFCPIIRGAAGRGNLRAAKIQYHVAKNSKLEYQILPPLNHHTVLTKLY